MTKQLTPAQEARMKGLTCSTPLDSHLFQMALTLNGTEDRLIQQAQQIIRTLEGVIKSVTKGQMVNSLGELQGSALSFDILCAVRGQQEEALRVLKDIMALQAEEDSK